MAHLVNLTPHAITLFKVTGESVTIEASGVVARCAVVTTAVGSIDGIKVNTTRFGEVTDLPDPVEGTYYVVSAMVLTALHGSRSDVLGVSEYVRNEAGQVVGAKALTH